MAPIGALLVAVAPATAGAMGSAAAEAASRTTLA